MGDHITDSEGAEVTMARMFRVFGLMLAVCAIAYSGIALMQESLKWDALDCYLPWRYFVGESLDHGIFPLWNPYQHFGYPIHADMRSVFYVEALVVGLLGGYSVQLLNVLFLFYLSVAGTAFYFLAGHFTSLHQVRLLGGFAYMLSGHFVGHGQDLGGIIAAAFIPFVLHYFIRLQQRMQWADLWKLALFLFLQLTGGYQALSMMLLYLLMSIFLMEMVRKREHRASLLRLLGLNAVLSVVVLLSLSVLVVSFYQVVPHIQRFGGVTLEDAHFMPFSPQCLISLITPFAVITDTDFYDTDLSMSNGHIGLLMLMGLLSALFRKRGLMEHIVLGFGVICLFASFGRYTPVREFLYQHVPLMDLFRMSGHFYYFSLLCFILVGTAEMGRLFSGPSIDSRRLLLTAGILLAAVAGTGIYFYATNEVTYRPLVFLSEYREHLGNTPRVHHVLIHAVLQGALLLLLIVGLWLSRGRKPAVYALLTVFLLLEMGAAVRLNFPITVGSGYSPAQIQNLLDNQAQGFPVPDLRTPVGAHRDGPQQMSPLWRNTNILTKTVSYDGFNSFRLDAFERFREDSTEAFQTALERPVVFFSGSDGQTPTDSIIMLRFAPGLVAFTTLSERPNTVTLQQTDYPGWQAYLDGVAVEHTLNGIFPTVQVPAGMHRVELHYRNPMVMGAFGVSYGMFALICAAVLFHLLREHRQRAVLITAAIMTLLSASVLVLWNSKSSDHEKRIASYEELVRSAEQRPKVPMLVLVDVPSLFDSIRHNLQADIEPLVLRDPDAKESIALRQWLSGAAAEGHESILVGRAALPLSASARELILQYFPREEQLVSGHLSISEFHRDGGPNPLFTIINDLEQHVADWPHDPSLTDSSRAYSGRFSWRMDAAMQGSPAIRVTLKDKKAEGTVKAVVSMKVFQTTAEANSTVYLKVERGEQVIWEMTQGFREQSPGAGQWFDAMLVARPPMALLPDDRILVFAWGGSNDPLFVDDLRLSLYAAP
jgi:hypothetical protein